MILDARKMKFERKGTYPTYILQKCCLAKALSKVVGAARVHYRTIYCVMSCVMCH